MQSDCALKTEWKRNTVNGSVQLFHRCWYSALSAEIGSEQNGTRCHEEKKRYVDCNMYRRIYLFIYSGLLLPRARRSVRKHCRVWALVYRKRMRYFFATPRLQETDRENQSGGTRENVNQRVWKLLATAATAFVRSYRDYLISGQRTYMLRTRSYWSSVLVWFSIGERQLPGGITIRVIFEEQRVIKYPQLRCKHGHEHYWFYAAMQNSLVKNLFLYSN